MLKALLGSVFGTRHDRERRRVQPIVDEINGHGARLQAMSEADLKGQTARFRSLIEARTAELRGRIDALKEQKRVAADAGGVELEVAQPDLHLDGAEAVVLEFQQNRKSTRLNSSHSQQSRMPSSA